MTRPHLRTPRIDLEPMTTAHLPDLVGLDADREVMRHLLGRARSEAEVHAFWGPVCADTEAAEALLDHGFGTCGLRVVVAETMAVNVAGRAVMRRLGMRHVRTELREWDDPLSGAAEGEVVHEVTAQEWATRRHRQPRLR